MYLMTGYLQCMYLFACEYMSLWLMNVGIILIALVNVDLLVFQFDSIKFFKKGYIFMSQNNAIMK